MRRWLKRTAFALCAISVAGITGLSLAGPALAYGGPDNNYACTPNPAPSAYWNGEVNKLISVTRAQCAANPEGQYLQTSGYGQDLDGGYGYYYIQQNPDGYTQLAYSDDTTGWYAYWQQNPPDPSHAGCSWYQEEVNDTSGHQWFKTGWFC